MKKEAIEYSRLIRMFCTPPSFPLSEGEMNALKKADAFTVRFEDWDLTCYRGALGFKFQITSTKFHSHTRWFQRLVELAETIM